MVTNSPYIFLSELESSTKPIHRPTEAVKVWFLLLHGCIAWKFRRCSRELPRKLSRQESSAKDRDQKLSMCWPTRCKNIQSGPPQRNTLLYPGCLSLSILYTEGLNWKWLCKSTHLLLYWFAHVHSAIPSHCYSTHIRLCPSVSLVITISCRALVCFTTNATSAILNLKLCGGHHMHLQRNTPGE